MQSGYFEFWHGKKSVDLMAELLRLVEVSEKEIEAIKAVSVSKGDKKIGDKKIRTKVIRTNNFLERFLKTSGQLSHNLIVS